jgi:diguanylate cyclase (GGDEF)-like protein
MTHPNPRTAAAVVPVLAWTLHAVVMRRRLELARRDPLTGLRTRAGWSEQAERMLRTQRADRDQVAVLMIDLDRFKAVNDTYGHAVGDQLLTAIAARLSIWAGPRGVVGRFGGDEFVVVVRLPVAGADLDERLRAVQTAIGQPVEVVRPGRPAEVIELRPSASIGVACTSELPGADLTRFLERADAAMYVAKAAGTGVRRADEHLPEAEQVNGRRRGRPGAAFASSTVGEVAA